MARPVKHARRVAAPVVVLLLTAAASTATAQTQTNVAVPGRGAGAFNVTFQHITMTERELIIVREEFGEVSSRAAYFELDYGLTDRLALAVTLPLKSIRYTGDQPHDPTLLANDHGEALLDDGNYHTNWGDIGFNLRWLWRSSDRFAITPFAGYYTPSNDYPLYTETQAGRGQWRWDVGINAAGRLGPPRRNLYWKAGYAYSYLEETRPTDAPAHRTNHAVLSFEVGWQATPRIMTYLTLNDVTTFDGVQIPDFTGIFVSDQFYYHDQLLPWEQTTWSLGLAYRLSDRLGLQLGYGRSAEVTFGHFYEPAFTFGISHGFARRNADLR